MSEGSELDRLFAARAAASGGVRRCVPRGSATRARSACPGVGSLPIGSHAAVSGARRSTATIRVAFRLGADACLLRCLRRALHSAPQVPATPEPPTESEGKTSATSVTVLLARRRVGDHRVVASYDLRYRPSDADEAAPWKQVTGLSYAAPYTVRGLSPETEYVFQSRAVNDVASEWSEEVRITTAASPGALPTPPPPEEVRTTAKQIIFKFNYPLTATEGAGASRPRGRVGYRLQKAESDGLVAKVWDYTWEDLADGTEVLGPNYAARELTPGAGYVFRVQAITEDGVSEWSAPSQVIRTADIPAPSTPRVPVPRGTAQLDDGLAVTVAVGPQVAHRVRVASPTAAGGGAAGGAGVAAMPKIEPAQPVDAAPVKFHLFYRATGMLSFAWTEATPKEGVVEGDFMVRGLPAGEYEFSCTAENELGQTSSTSDISPPLKLAPVEGQ